MKKALNAIFKIVFYGWNAVMFAVVAILVWNQMTTDLHPESAAYTAGGTVIAVILTAIVWGIGSVIFGSLARVSSH
jgi:hypothetical protein